MMKATLVSIRTSTHPFPRFKSLKPFSNGLELGGRMKKNTATMILVLAALLLGGFPAYADTLGFDGDKLVEPDCATMSAWFECRNIDGPDIPENVLRGYFYVHHTSSTLGPDGYIKFPDGTPYAGTTAACSSCHFTGGHVPFGTPFYQVPDKFAERPYFRPLNYRRGMEDAIIDCFSNCMNNAQRPAKDDPVIQDIVAYIEWVANGVTDPALMGAGWKDLPGHSLPVVDLNVAHMVADPIRGRVLFEDAVSCAGCHSKDGPGQGEYRPGDDRPRFPALWGQNSSTRGAALFNIHNLAGYIREHMPYGDPKSLSAQEALDIAAHINDQPRPSGLADQMFCHTESDGIPGSLRKPASWLVGCRYPGEPFTDEQIRYGPWAPITAWRNAEIARLKAGQ